MTKNICNKSILVLDDNSVMLGALDKLLAREGADVTCEVWAGDVLKLLEEPQKEFDLVITDLSMPSMSGLVALNAIHKVFPKLPIIVLTAFSGPDIERECLSQGASAFLEKPFQSLQLLETIERILDTQTEKTEARGHTGKSSRGELTASTTKKNSTDKGNIYKEPSKGNSNSR